MEKVWPIKGYVLGIKFSDGCTYELDFDPMIRKREDALHVPLRDEEYFRQAYVNGLTVEWPNGLDVCPDGLRRWCEAGRVISEEAHELESALGG